MTMFCSLCRGPEFVSYASVDGSCSQIWSNCLHRGSLEFISRFQVSSFFVSFLFDLTH